MQSCIYGYVFEERRGVLSADQYGHISNTCCVWLECKTYLTLFSIMLFFDFLFFPKNSLLIFFCIPSSFFVSLNIFPYISFLSFFLFSCIISFLFLNLLFLVSFIFHCFPTPNSPSHYIAQFLLFLFFFLNPRVDLIHPISELLSSLKHLVS